MNCRRLELLFPRLDAGYPTTRWTIQNRENALWRWLVTLQLRLICVRRFYRPLSSLRLSTSTKRSLKSSAVSTLR
jgi:hypothetical protein